MLAGTRRIDRRATARASLFWIGTGMFIVNSISSYRFVFSLSPPGGPFFVSVDARVFFFVGPFDCLACFVCGFFSTPALKPYGSENTELFHRIARCGTTYGPQSVNTGVHI